MRPPENPSTVLAKLPPTLKDDPDVKALTGIAHENLQPWRSSSPAPTPRKAAPAIFDLPAH